MFLFLTRSRTGLTGHGLFGARLLATFAIAIASFVLVEQPIRQRRLPSRLGVGRHSGRGGRDGGRRAPGHHRSGHHDPDQPGQLQLASGPRRPAGPRPRRAHETHPAHRTSRRSWRVIRSLSPWPSASAGAPGSRSTAKPDLVVASRRGACGSGASSDRPAPTTTSSPSGGRWWARGTPTSIAVLLGRWEVHDHRYGGRWTHIGEPAYDAHLADRLDRGVAALASRGAHVVLLTAPYYDGLERPDGGRWPEDDRSRVDRFNRILRDVAARHGGQVTVIDLGRMLSPRRPVCRQHRRREGAHRRRHSPHAGRGGVDRSGGPSGARRLGAAAPGRARRRDVVAGRGPQPPATPVSAGSSSRSTGSGGSGRGSGGWRRLTRIMAKKERA